MKGLSGRKRVEGLGHELGAFNPPFFLLNREQLVRHRCAGYILGAGSLPADLADKSLQESGLVFGATYCIFDVRAVAGQVNAHTQSLRPRTPSYPSS